MESENNATQEESAQFSRRNVLQSVGGSAAALGISVTSISNAEAIEKNDAINKTEQRLVDIKISTEIETPSEGNLMTTQKCSTLPGYYLGEEGAFAVSSDIKELKGASAHIRTPSDVIAVSSEDANVELLPTISGDCNGYEQKTYEMAGDQNSHSFDVRVEENQTVVKSGSEELFSVEINQTMTHPLGEQQAIIQRYEEQEIENTRDSGPETVIRSKEIDRMETPAEPIITVQDHGSVSLHTTPKKYIFPNSMPGAHLLLNHVDSSEVMQHSGNIGSSPHDQSNIITVEEVSQ